jgi:hypothetical protein
MSEATRKRDAGGVLKNHNETSDDDNKGRESSKMPYKIEEKVVCGFSDRREITDFRNSIAKIDRERLVEICTDIATSGSNIDPNETKFRQNIVLSWREPSRFLSHFKLCVERKNDVADTFDGLVTDFVIFVKLDRCGREGAVQTTQLTVEDYKANCALNLPAAISGLRELTRLRFVSCRIANCPYSLPAAIIGLRELTRLDLVRCGIDDRQLEALIFDVLPMIPSISVLGLQGNIINSFRNINLRLNNSGNGGHVHRSSLVSINLDCNPIVGYKRKNDSEEVRAVCLFLRAFPSIQCIKRYPCSWPASYGLDPSILHELWLNKAGRRLVEGGDNDRHVSLSVWPAVLGRITKEFWKKNSYHRPHIANGIYYMLRNGPVLLESKAHV